MSKESPNSRFRRYSNHEGPIYYPQVLTDIVQPILRQALLSLARYEVSISGEQPNSPSLLLAYPHNEHINTLFFSPLENGAVVARDYWYENIFLRGLLATLYDTVPITRTATGTNTLKKEIQWQADLMEKRGKNILVYPQGSRIGSVDSPQDLAESLKRGVALMARSLQVPVYPVGIEYPEGYEPRKDGEDAWKRFTHSVAKRTLPERVKIQVHYGTPILPPENRAHDTEFLSTVAHTLWFLAHPRSVKK